MLSDNYYYLTMCSNKNTTQVKIFTNIESAYVNCIHMHNKLCCSSYNKKINSIDSDLLFSSLFVCACDDNSTNNEQTHTNLSNVNYKDIIDEYIFSTNSNDIQSKYYCKKCNSNLLECAVCQINIYDLVKKLDCLDNAKSIYFGEHKENILIVKKINFITDPDTDKLLDFEIKN